ncbi:hypothetical protein ACXWO8_09415, partial [Streptococcus pyogenes]
MDGRPYLVSEARLQSGPAGELGWRIVARQPLDEALRPVKAFRRQLFLLGVLAAGVLALAALLLARRFSKPVEALARMAAR